MRGIYKIWLLLQNMATVINNINELIKQDKNIGIHLKTFKHRTKNDQ